MVDRLHSPQRNIFKVKKLGLLLVAADTIPTVFDAIKVQYQSVLEYFKLEDAGMVLVRGVQERGDIEGNEALKEAYSLGKSIV